MDNQVVEQTIVDYYYLEEDPHTTGKLREHHVSL